jgi:hypothetical protein
MDNINDNNNKRFIKENPWIIILAILLMGSILFFQVKNNWANKEKAEWQEKDFKEMVHQCILETKEMGTKYPELTKEYCSCSIKQIQDNFKKDEYESTLSKPLDEQRKLILPIIQSCLTEYRNKMSQENKNKN